MPFNIDGKIINIKYIVTECGEILASGSDFAMALTGCDHKVATSKISTLYKSYPQLRPAKHELCYYSKV